MASPVSLDMLRALLHERERAEERLVQAIHDRLEETEGDHAELAQAVAILAQRVERLEQDARDAAAQLIGAKDANLDRKGRVETLLSVFLGVVASVTALAPIVKALWNSGPPTP